VWLAGPPTRPPLRRDSLGAHGGFLKTASSLDPRWREYRRRRNSLFAALLTWMGLLLVVVLFPNAPVLGPFWWLFALPIFIWFMIANFRIAFWECPACSRAYFTKGIWFARVFAQRCLHCGLPKWSVPDAGAHGA